MADDTVYRDADDLETTSYTYAWSSTAGVTAPLSATASLPVVFTDQNGSGLVDTTMVVYDAYGRAVWTKDASGCIGYTAYDNATGAVVEQIVDVNMSGNTGDSQFQSALALLNGLTGWTTPAGGGLNLTTTYQVDALGRTTKMIDPDGNVTFTVYKDPTSTDSDPSSEIRVYSGWRFNTTTGRTCYAANRNAAVTVYRADLP